MDYLTLNLEELFEEIKERAQKEGAYTREEWNDITDELLEEKRDVGEMHDDSDWEEIREALKMRYEEFETEVQEV